MIGVVWAQIDSKVLQNGFRKGGIFPFNPEEIQDKQFDPMKFKHWKELQTTAGNNVTPRTPENPHTLTTLAINQVNTCLNIPPTAPQMLRALSPVVENAKNNKFQ